MRQDRRKQIIDLAIRAKNGEPAALREFTELARKAGYEGRRGGWIYRSDSHGGPAVCQGWQRLAQSLSSAMIDEFIAAERTPAPGFSTDAETGALLDEVLGAEPEPATAEDITTGAYSEITSYGPTGTTVRVVHTGPRREPAWWTPEESKAARAAIELVRRMDEVAPAHRVVRTSMIPTNHIAPLRVVSSGDAGGIGRLLCGRLMGGPTEPLNLDRVDCLGCLDEYTAILAGRTPDPHRPADVPAETRSPLIAP